METTQIKPPNLTNLDFLDTHSDQPDQPPTFMITWPCDSTTPPFTHQSLSNGKEQQSNCLHTPKSMPCLAAPYYENHRKPLKFYKRRAKGTRALMEQEHPKPTAPLELPHLLLRSVPNPQDENGRLTREQRKTK